MGTVENNGMTAREKYEFLQKTSWKDLKDKPFNELPAATIQAIDEAYAQTVKIIEEKQREEAPAGDNSGGQLVPGGGSGEPQNGDSGGSDAGNAGASGGQSSGGDEIGPIPPAPPADTGEGQLNEETRSAPPV